MTINSYAYEEAFNLLCGDKLGEGMFRVVFECKIDPELVVKVEKDDTARNFQNVLEWQFWDHWRYSSATEKWLAPCVKLSPCGYILLQKRTLDLQPRQMPAKLPAFLTDVKPENYGLLDGRVVCRDYAMTVTNVSTRLRKAEWD